jgi:hypothetical protein
MGLSSLPNPTATPRRTEALLLMSRRAISMPTTPRTRVTGLVLAMVHLVFAMVHMDLSKLERVWVSGAIKMRRPRLVVPAPGIVLGARRWLPR